MKIESSHDTLPWCASYTVFCDGSRMITFVEMPDGTVVYNPPGKVKCVMEFCERRDDSRTVIRRLKERGF